MCRSKPDFSIARLFARGNPHMTEAECSAYDAPFPNADYRAATRKFPEMVPEEPEADGVAVSRRAALFWSNEWTGRSMMAVGMRDPVFSLTLDGAAWKVNSRMSVADGDCQRRAFRAGAWRVDRDRGVAIACVAHASLKSPGAIDIQTGNVEGLLFEDRCASKSSKTGNCLSPIVSPTGFPAACG